MLDFKKMMEQAQQMQFKMQELQEKFKDIEVEGQAGGGLVKVTLSCTGVVKSIKIDDSLIKPDDREMLEDLVAAAVNQANEAREARVQEETQNLMGSAGLNPEAFGSGLPF